MCTLLVDWKRELSAKRPHWVYFDGAGGRGAHPIDLGVFASDPKGRPPTVHPPRSGRLLLRRCGHSSDRGLMQNGLSDTEANPFPGASGGGMGALLRGPFAAMEVP